MFEYISYDMIEAIWYYLLFNITFYLSNAILFVLDYYQIIPDEKINIQDNQSILSIYKKCLPCVLFNTLIASWLPCLIMAWYKSDTNTTNTAISEFSLVKCVFDILISMPIADVFLYTSHRLFHIPFLYKKFHKQHHEILTPIGLSAVYMTTTDFYFGNILPIFLPMYIMNAHTITIKIWLVMIILNTTFLAHSGYRVANYHNKHHSLFNKNYGAHVFMDRLFGTYSD